MKWGYEGGELCSRVVQKLKSVFHAKKLTKTKTILSDDPINYCCIFYILSSLSQAPHISMEIGDIMNRVTHIKSSTTGFYGDTVRSVESRQTYT